MPAAAPIYVLADSDIFTKAPYRLTASGISDLMGKYTALLDWKVSHIVTNEYFCTKIYDLELEALHEVESELDGIKLQNRESTEKLMYALILSGLAMQMIGNSRPASGAEHHVSHLWEMEILNGRLDALHGEKVSIGLIMCLERYQQIRNAIKIGQCKVTAPWPQRTVGGAIPPGKKWSAGSGPSPQFRHVLPGGLSHGAHV